MTAYLTTADRLRGLLNEDMLLGAIEADAALVRANSYRVDRVLRASRELGIQIELVRTWQDFHKVEEVIDRVVGPGRRG